MSPYLVGAVSLLLLSSVVGSAFGQDGTVPLRCETFCSQSKLRTASARLSWTDPALQSGAAGASVAGSPPAPPQLDVTVVRNGFSTNAYATFPTAEAGSTPSPNFATQPSAAPRLRAYDLRITGALRPAITGTLTTSDVVAAAERRETTLLVENLEPGLRYSWRLRFNTAGGEQVTAPAICVAPVCPADMKE